jgi:hypothetical protein
MFDWITEAEAVALPGMGEERFRRLVRGGWLRPFFTVEGREGEGVFRKDFVLMRRDEDRRTHPDGRPAVVTKAYRGGAPEVVIDRDGVRHLVVRKAAAPAAAGRLSPGVKAELQGLLALARRVLASRAGR